jgi:hypothetical protein
MSDAISIDEFVRSDDAIFHYTKLSLAIETILHDGRFRLGLLKNTNDPWEYKFKLLSMFGSSLPPITDQLYNDAHEVIDRIIREESRVMCFCSNISPTVVLNIQERLKDLAPPSLGCYKSRMWAQYGENHRGICLVFSKKKIDDKFAGATGSLFTNHVTYTARSTPPLDAYTLNGDELIRDGVENYCYNHIKRHSDDLFFIKNIDYRDECEYRVVVVDPDRQYKFIDISAAIRMIIAGDRTPKVYYPIIRQQAEKYGAHCRYVHWERGMPFLFKFTED